MKAFVVKGRFLMGDRWQNFEKEVASEDENAVKEQIYSRLGSKHRVKRANIQILEIKGISPESVSDPITSHILQQEIHKKPKMPPKPKIGGEKPKKAKLLKKKSSRDKTAKGVKNE